MKLQEIKANIYPEDKMMVAVSHEVTEDYINRILRGDRSTNSETAKSILKKLRKLAKLNERVSNRKTDIITK